MEVLTRIVSLGIYSLVRRNNATNLLTSMTKPFDLTGWTSYQQRFLREPPLSLRYVRGWRAPCKSGVFPLGERHT